MATLRDPKAVGLWKLPRVDVAEEFFGFGSFFVPTRPKSA